MQRLETAVFFKHAPHGLDFNGSMVTLTSVPSLPSGCSALRRNLGVSQKVTLPLKLALAHLFWRSSTSAVD
jgi:hypothetical protein